MSIHDELHPRLFVCLFPDPPVQAEIEQLRLDRHWPKDRWWTEPERLHQTLLSPGDVPESRIPGLCDALLHVQGQATRLMLGRTQMGKTTAVLLPDRDAGLAGLKTLQDRIASVVSMTGAALGHQARPHITLSRHAQNLVMPAMRIRVPWTVHEFCLVWSQLRPEYPKRHYEVLGRYPLSAPVAVSGHEQLGLGF